MDKEEREYLAKFYYLLHDNLLREKSLKDSSVLVSFLETIGSSRVTILSKSTIHSSLISESILLALSTKKLIQPLGSISNYAITAKGVWEYERDAGLLAEDTLLSYINTKFFSGNLISGIKHNLDEKESVILFAMIAARAFSEKSCVDTKKNESVKGKWLEILEQSYDFLAKMQIIKSLSKEDFLGKKGNEHIVGYVFRHNGPMLQKTNGIYNYTRKQEYFLNLYKEGSVSKDELNFLFWKLFKGELSADSVDKVLDFCNSTSREDIFLYDMAEHIFAQPIFDSLIKDSLLDSIVSKTRWSSFA
jgi:hypothetical protein